MNTVDIACPGSTGFKKSVDPSHNLLKMPMLIRILLLNVLLFLFSYSDSVSLKPHRKKRPFIEKKKAVSFHLVHRSQRDPLAADETAPQRVLLPTQKVGPVLQPISLWVAC